MAELEITDDKLYEYLDIQAIVAVNKFDRLIRKLYALSKGHVVDKEGQVVTKDRIKFLLDLDKQQIINQYNKIYDEVKDWKREIMPGQDSPEKQYVCDKAYEQSALVIREKLTLQVNYWHETRQVMIFETLTLADENLGDQRKIDLALRAYKRKLRQRTDAYIIVYELGSKKGRPHWHVLYNSPSGKIVTHGNWRLGRPDTQRVKYLGDGHTSEAEAILNGWSLAAVVNYMVKYVAKDVSDRRETDEYKYRTQMSRGFGTWQMRKKLLLETTQKLKQIVMSGTTRYMRIFRIESQKELARRLNIPLDVLKRDLTTPETCAIQRVVSSRKVTSGHYRKITQEVFDGYEKWLKL